MLRSRLTRFVALSLLVSACSGHHENPILPTDPGSGSGVEQFTVAVAAGVSQVTAGTTTPTPLTITAKHADGTAPKDGAEVAVNTNIGNFGVDAAGKPVQLIKTTLVAGAASVNFFAGSETGVANIMAQIGTNVGRLNLPVVAAPPAPVANFTFATNGLNVLFTDASTGSPTAYLWQFGDGGQSTEKSPAHSYAAPGTYAATLQVSNAGGSSSKSQFVTVTLGSAPTASFDFTVTGNQVNFVDKSTGNPTSWSWVFGDGGSSTSQNPIHAYGAAGSYTVTLTVRNAGGENAASKVVTIAAGTPPVAAFEFQASGLQVNFVDKSTGGPTSWSWAFGDGGTSSQQNPIHTYPAAGNYTVTLTAINANGSNGTSQVVAVTAGTPPTAKFAFTANGGQVNFVDQSTGAPTAWSWNFGDGSSDTAQNPVHVYANAGSFTVTLTASNANGSNATSQVVTIAAGSPPVADFTFSVSGYRVNFIDRSTGTPTSYNWQFGDGTSDTAANPVHTYGAAGSYTVQLTVTNANGSNSKAYVVTVPSPPVADFTFSRSGTQVTFTDLSTGSPTGWSWDFGDGNFSSVQNPVHNYASGTYTVKLIATNPGGSTATSKTVTVP